MGKSGHVARKIAATLASTGTPALFVHPAEASHGDLGMVRPTTRCWPCRIPARRAELAAILAYASRFAIPLIAMTGSADNTLAAPPTCCWSCRARPRPARWGWRPPPRPPQMALGDALAVALMERRGFSEHDYRIFHPGGQIGRILLKVSEVMHGPEGKFLGRRQEW